MSLAHRSSIQLPALDLLWSDARRFCCEPLLRGKQSGLFQLESSGLSDSQRSDRLRLVVVVAYW